MTWVCKLLVSAGYNPATLLPKDDFLRLVNMLLKMQPYNGNGSSYIIGRHRMSSVNCGGIVAFLQYKDSSSETLIKRQYYKTGLDHEIFFGEPAWEQYWIPRYDKS